MIRLVCLLLAIQLTLCAADVNDELLAAARKGDLAFCRPRAMTKRWQLWSGTNGLARTPGPGIPANRNSARNSTFWMYSASRAETRLGGAARWPSLCGERHSDWNAVTVTPTFLGAEPAVIPRAGMRDGRC